MVLRAVGSDVRADALLAQAGTASVWTVDLAFLLVAHGVSPRYCTSQLGCNPGFEAELCFYTQRISSDRARVEALFAKAASSGTPHVEQHILSRAELIHILRDGHAVAIVLVDRRHLYGEGGPALAAQREGGAGEAPRAESISSAVSWLLSRAVDLIFQPVLRAPADEQAGPHLEPGPGRASAGSVGFTGHYVCIVGLSPAADAYIVHDPSCDRGANIINLDELDRARGCYGTDNDILICNLTERTRSAP
ncbi:Guanylylate cyclase-domain-containing protein [Pavlovales sp. CCMP2436]|nr:Guanylylate cyclase-domain-containing protein [Pavlovales sp. CCMP2436]